jgi:hypothetical protein
LKQKSTTLAPKKNNEKLEATITVDNLVSTMKTSMPSEKILRERMKYFVLQDFRGYIVYYREASTRQTTCLKKYHLCGDWMDRPEKNKDQRTNLHGADGRNDGRIHQRTHLIN